MLESLVFSINTVFPIFIIVFIGAVIKKMKFLDDSFFSQSERLVFKVALPAMLFIEIATAEKAVVFDGNFILYCVLGVAGSFILLCVTVPFVIKSNDKRGAFIQGAYRSNFAILGVPLAENMFGNSGTTQIAMVMPFAITLFNLFAVMILSIYAPEDKKVKPSEMLKNIAVNVVKNPLIISVLAGVLFRMTGITLPFVFHKSLTYLSNMSLPLALMSLGANFTVSSFKSRFGLAMISAILKIVIIPLITVVIAILLGFRNEQLGVIFILFGGPTAVSSYIMAKNMDSDYELAGQIMLLSTLFCIITIFFGVFILGLLNYIQIF